MSVNDFSNNGKGLATQHTDALHVFEHYQNMLCIFHSTSFLRMVFWKGRPVLSVAYTAKMCQVQVSHDFPTAASDIGRHLQNSYQFLQNGVLSVTAAKLLAGLLLKLAQQAVDLWNTGFELPCLMTRQSADIECHKTQVRMQLVLTTLGSAPLALAASAPPPPVSLQKAHWLWWLHDSILTETCALCHLHYVSDAICP